MKSFFDNLPDTGPIKLRDAFMGGRTGPEYLYAASSAYDEMASNEQQQQQHPTQSERTTIKLKDVKSLYPAMYVQINIKIKFP